MTTIEQLKSQLKICQDLGLTADAEKLQQRLVELENPITNERIETEITSPLPIVTAPTIPESDWREFEAPPLDVDDPPRRLYMDSEREEIIEEILRLERKHIREGLHYDRVRYLGDNTLNRRKEFLLDYLYSLCDHLEHYIIGIHDLAERQAIREYEREVEQKLRLQQKSKVEPFPDRRRFSIVDNHKPAERKHFDFLPERKAS